MKFEEYINESSIKAAFFISPSRKIVYAPTTHIDMILKNPEKFGFTREKLEKIYAKYDEKIGVEGKAREEIIQSLIKKGWIHIRRISNRQWNISVNKITKKVKDLIYDWANKIIKGVDGFREDDVYMPVYLWSLSGSDSKMTTVDGISKDDLYEKYEFFDSENMLIESNIENL